MAVGAGLAIGAFLIVIDQTSDESGLVPLVMTRVTNIAITARRSSASSSVRGAARAGGARHPSSTRPASRSARRRPATPTSSTPPPARTSDAGAQPAASRTRAWWLAIACGVVDAAANALMLLALRIGDLSIVSALTALYPAGTILLAAIVLRERVAAVQWVGLALALVAGGMLALA